MHTMPATRGHAMFVRAINFPAGTSEARALLSISANAVAAWRHHNGAITYVKWASAPMGPRATLACIADGPRYFARDWVRMFVNEVVARSALFARLSQDVLRAIVTAAGSR